MSSLGPPHPEPTPSPANAHTHTHTHSTGEKQGRKEIHEEDTLATELFMSTVFSLVDVASMLYACMCWGVDVTEATAVFNAASLDDLSKAE